MARNVRTTKTLAKRMDLQYFSAQASAAQLAILSVSAGAGDRGGLVLVVASDRAEGLQQRTALVRACRFRQAVRSLSCDRARRISHRGQGHCLSQLPRCSGASSQQVEFTPACGSCHVEHKGPVKLAHTASSTCTQCHTNLRVKTGQLRYFESVRGFDGARHPEFVELRPGSDPGTVKLNHYAHLKKNLAGPNGPVQLTCQDCHRLTGEEGAWPYALGGMKTVSASEKDAMPTTEGSISREVLPHAYMAPIRYATQCAACHTKDLQFDKRFNESVPHDKPEVVQAFLVKKYTDYFATHPNALSEPLPPNRILSGNILPPMPPPPHTREEWINGRSPMPIGCSSIRAASCATP